MVEKNESKSKKTIVGEVISSNKMNKTIVVAVKRSFAHPLLEKVMRTTKKYKVHDENEQAKVGDLVEIYEGRPVSKTKYMYLERIIRSHAQQSA